ncbi:hypothetical protein ACH4A3_07715 [Streptomyces sp. NPDC018007]|uniref:hypothetical protein n=1 Tax=Streptomyces sp. NPDC018007 TaxID=3365029 RepID=UPI0037A3B007
MSGIDVGEEPAARAARARALSLLRIRGRALAVAILPAAVAVVLFAAGAQGRLAGPVWDAARWTVLAVAAAVLLVTVPVAVAVARARPAVSPTVPVPEEGAPDLYRLVRELADRLGVPAPSAIALTPDCDSWLEDRTHRALRKGPGAPGDAEAADTAPVLVIGSPFLWWMRVAELRAVLAPVVAGTGPSADPDIAAARRFVRGLDAAIADAAAPGRGALRGAPLAFVGWVSRLLLRACRDHAAEMERCVAAAGSLRARTVDQRLRVTAQEQVGLAYAGWDRLLTRVALPAWRMGRWPSRLDAGVVSALTELSRRDRLADGFALRLGERPACDLLEEPGTADEAASLLAARLFHGGPAESGPDWAPVDWQQYPDEVVDRKWRSEAARLHRVLDTLGVPRASAADPADPTLARVVEHLSGPGGSSEELAAGIGAAVAREEAGPRSRGGAGHACGGAGGPAYGGGAADDPLDLWGPGPLPLFPLQPPRTGAELLADHVAAMVCCAAVDTAGAAPGLDWLDGPALLVGGERRADLADPVLSLVEDGDPDPLLSWLAEVGVRTDKPVRLV